MALRPPAAATFDVGLVMAGAASAGAYTAGVVDFLLEALQAWEDAKISGDPLIPDHHVQIKVAAGTSAGGIVAAFLGMLPFTGHSPITDLAVAPTSADAQNAERNLLYSSWVSAIDLSHMLAVDDIVGGEGGVRSLLNGNVLDDIAERAVQQVRAALPSRRAIPSYIADPLQLCLCVTNVRGVPYIIRMVADETMRGHRVKNHADHGHFAIFGPDSTAALPAGAIPVNLPGTLGDLAADGWDRLRDAALATAAFPGGFPARPFFNSIEAYRSRPGVGPAAAVDAERLAVTLDLPHGEAPAPYHFWCIDGGLINNEPLDHARTVLTGSPKGEQPGDPQGNWAVLLIDPFPEDTPARDQHERALDLLDSVFALLPILREHAAFKPQDIMLALREDVRSRFLLAPMREIGCTAESYLASDGLVGFAGFVSEQFRMHDFQLGRRNCQKFLRDHFYLPVEHPLVRNWVERLKPFPDLLHRYQPDPSCGRTGDRTPGDLVQVIPLMDSVSQPVQLRPWPTLSQKADIDPLRRLIKKRAQAIVPEIIRGLLFRLGVTDPGFVKRTLGSIAGDMITRRVADQAAQAIESDLRARHLLY